MVVGGDAITKQWIKNKADEAAVANGCYFDLAKAERVKEFITRFVRIRSKQGTKAFELLPWQWDNVVAPLFGWRQANGLRRFREAYISVGKKNGKTILLAVMLLAFLVLEVGPGQECYSFATEREQAAQIYREAAKLIAASPELAKILVCTRSTKTISFEAIGSFFQSKSAEADSADGLNIPFCVYDEIHRAANRELYDALKYSGTAIEERTGEVPLLVLITTAGWSRESIAYERYTYAKRVRDGIIADDSHYCYIAEAQPGDDWKAEATWNKANPSLGCGVMPLKNFQRDFTEAKNNPAGENTFRRLRLNQWTEQASRWIPHDLWDKNGGVIDLDKLKGKECYCGLDLSSNQDTTALSLVFPRDGGGYDCLWRIWIPKANVEARGLRHGVGYSTWEKQGHLLTTPSNSIDYAEIRRTIRELGTIYKIKEIAFDPWRADELTKALQNEDGFRMVEKKQGPHLSPPANYLYRLLLEGKINHGNNPVARWQAGNIEGKFDRHENVILDKAGDKFKIDAIVALIMAIDRAISNKKTNTRGISIAFI